VVAVRVAHELVFCGYLSPPSRLKKYLVVDKSPQGGNHCTFYATF
jgi:hypothetical protein